MPHAEIGSQFCFVCGLYVPYADKKLSLRELGELQRLSPPERVAKTAQLLSVLPSQAEIWLRHYFNQCEEPVADCPFCGALLRTSKAKQCGSCGTAWHDSKRVRHLSAV